MPRARRHSMPRAPRWPTPSARAAARDRGQDARPSCSRSRRKNLWPPVIDHVTVEKGYETALGAALGDDLDAPVDPSAPMRWAGAAIDAVRSGAAGRRRAARRATCRRRPNWRAGSRRSAWSSAPTAPRLAATAQARPAAGVARRRSVALGRLCRRRACADRRRAPARRAQPPGRHRRRTGDRARRRRRQAQRARGRASELTAARGRSRRPRALARGAARGRHRARAARRRRARGGAQRRAPLGAGRGQDAPDRRPRRGERRQGRGRARARPRCRPPPISKASSPPCAPRSTAKRAELAEVRAEQQALAREAELADRRLDAIAADTAGWSERRDGARNQIATLDPRIAEAKRERAALDDAPQVFAEKRRALIGEIETAEAARRAGADRLAEAENALAEADRAARAALEALGAAREEAARAEERFEGAKRRLADIAPRNPRDAGSRARRRRRRWPSIKPGARAARRRRRSRPSSSSCAASASGSAPSTCAPRKNCARSRPSTPR